MTTKNATDSPASDPALIARGDARRPATDRSRGAPEGNVNAAKDPTFTRAMREAQAAARRGRRRRLASHFADARRMIVECGLEDSPLGDRLAARLAQSEAEIVELGLIVERVGRTKRDGSLSPAYERRLSLIREDRLDCRALLDRLAELAKTKPGPKLEDYLSRRSASAAHDDSEKFGANGPSVGPEGHGTPPTTTGTADALGSHSPGASRRFPTSSGEGA